MIKLLSILVFLVTSSSFAYDVSGQIVFERISNFHWQTENIVRYYRLSEDNSQCILTTKSSDGLTGNPDKYEVVSLELCNLQRIEDYLKEKLGSCGFSEHVLNSEREGDSSNRDSGWMTDVTKVTIYSYCKIRLSREYRKMKSFAATMLLNPFAVFEGPWRDFSDTEYFPSEEMVESLFTTEQQKNVVRDAFKLFPRNL